MRSVKQIWREPLVHFLVIGAGLFLLFGVIRGQGNDAPNRIVVDSSQVEQLAGRFERTWLRPPTEVELARLLDGHVREEVYYREALAMGLDQDDPQVRQRMRMKLEFLLEDLTAEDAPGDEVLQAYLQQHPDKFSREPQVSFQQRYLNPDKRPDFEVDARRMLGELEQGAAPESIGDPTLLASEFTLATPSHIGRSFGEAFAEDVTRVTPGGWTGPVYSRLGVHLVKVTERVEGYLPALAEVRAEVEREYLAQRRQESKDMAYQQLRQGYEVVIDATTAAERVAGQAVAAYRPERAAR